MGSHTAGADWQSFELRMRRRRAERLALRADVAADAGYPEDARACLEEARTLAPGLPELALIEAKLLAAPRPGVPSSTSKWILVAAACAAAMIGGVAMPRTASAPAAIAARPIPHAASPADIAAPPRVAATIPPARPEESERKREREVPAARTVGQLGLRTVEPAIRIGTAGRTERTAMAAVPEVSALPPVPVPAPVPVVAEPIADLPPAAPSAVTAPAEPAQESVVRSVLSRYASAYSSLDANAAQRVWPGVNRAALSRAFDGLASQQISLGECRIDVAASSARAHCAGSATWAPKVGGGGPRTEARDWTFELARAASGWQIVRARVQNR
jgi:hypothetical protein